MLENSAGHTAELKHLDTKEYNRLLTRMLLVPLLALLLLAAGLAYSLHRMQKAAAWVDHSDQVLAEANRLLGLIVDEETGVRGYFLTHDPAFLEPYRNARQLLPEEFNQILAMTQDNPAQTAHLRQLQQDWNRWSEEAQQDVMQQAAPPHLLRRKQQMDAIRTEAQSFVDAEQKLRRQRSATALDVGWLSRGLLLGLILVIGIVIAWLTRRSFSQCVNIFGLQLQDSEIQRNRAAEAAGWLNTVLRSIGDGVIACDPQGNVAIMNPVAEELTGWPEHEAIGHPLPEIFHIVNEHTRAIVENPVDKVRRTGATVGLANHTILIRKDGSESGIDDSASPIRNQTGEMLGIVLVFRDCTERRSSEFALMRAEKLAAAGKLAASIAHEVNNPLEGLTNMLYLAAESKDLNEVRGWLTQAQAEVNRLSHITRRTLGFYRESANPVSYRPADVMEDVMAFYVPEALSKNVQLEAQVRTQQSLYGIPGELRQVISNLLANSLDAMPKGGIIRLVVRQAKDLKDETKRGIRITVADNGSGIPRSILQHVFEPFFTTKMDTGTGLGLWVSKELIEKQGGHLRVHSSTKGGVSGTVFSIYIPIDTAHAGRSFDDEKDSRG